MNGNRKKTGVVNDEVEELLRAAQDAALLKFSLNSHTVHSSSSDLDPNLEQRYRALKTGPKPGPKSKVFPKQTPPTRAEKVKEEVGEDDLFARFSALKASLPNSSSSASSVGVDISDVSKLAAAGGLVVDGDDVDEEDEVEKIIRWAKDAARLDPSPPSDDDDDEIKDDDYDDDDDDDDEKSDDDDIQEKNKKGHWK